MNKRELCARVADATSPHAADADAAVNAVFSTVAGALAAGDTVNIAGFCAFSIKHRPARQGRNPRTGERIAIPASNAPAFKPAKVLREAVK